MAEATNPFGEGFEEAKSGNFVKWEKVGQQVKGILRSVHESDNFNKDGKQNVYVIEQEDGSDIQISSRGDGFDRAMSKVLIGQMVGLFYAEDIETDKGNAFKLVKVYPGQLVEESAGE